MTRIYRLGTMILLFWFLASGIAASPLSVPEKATSPGPVAAYDGEGLRLRTSLTDVTPAWYPRVEIETKENADGPGPIEPDLQRALENAATDDFIRVIVHMRERAGTGVGALSGLTEAEVRAQLASTLKATANRSQAPVRAFLDAETAVGQVASYQPFWITNAIAVRAAPSIVRLLADQPSVAAVHLDHWRRWIDSETPDRMVSAVEQPRLRIPDASGVDSATPCGMDHLHSRSDDTEPVEWNVSRVRADQVWHSLHISGTGAVVAGMDTGVDWLHPALRSNYRGYNPHGPANHTLSWYDATGQGALYPVDGHGHGSHTLGTVVGQDGIGVAPGARWIGVRVLNSEGYGYDSWIHAGFQWLLAPGDDPSMAPDVVNCSWGNDNAHLTVFQDDLRALRAAGILPVVSSGNSGPRRASVGSPASLPEAFAVGALDQYDEVASFSGRGPSPWGEIRPHVAAPGVQVRSSTPGGAYASQQGTSMAAPHVSGVVAMLRSVSPTLSITRTVYAITSTAFALGGQIPNNDTGWGRVDAFAAVAAVAQSGFITGTVRQTPDPETHTASPIAGAKVTASTRGDGGGGTSITASDGTYRLGLAPKIYDLTASAFGYQSVTLQGIRVISDTAIVKDFALTPQPGGSLHVRVSDASTRQPITATVTVLDTPHEVVSHTHTFALPAGTYSVRARRLGYRVVTATAGITVGEMTAVDLALPQAPSILLVDSGGWYYESQAAYFRQALDDLSYAYDEWPIRRLPEDVPPAYDLGLYEIVVWTAPRDAPGYIGAAGAVAEYLEGGGRLLLTGQDVGFWDGGGSGLYGSPYYRDYLKARLVDDNAPTRELQGVDDGILAGTTLTIEGAGGADNQDYPDVIAITDADAARPVLIYGGGGCGGLQVGTCLNYRVLYYPFGIEGINDRTDRRNVMERSLKWLDATPPAVGLELDPQRHLGIGPPGSVVTHTLRVRHVGQSGGTDDVSLTLEGMSWPTVLSDSTVALSPCTSASVVVSVTIPVTATWDLGDAMTLTVRSSLSPTLAVSAGLTTKAPAPTLLVDDDRWYDQTAVYEEAMTKASLPYDLWPTSPEAAGGHTPGPPLDVLQRYPVIVWWTGYDWYAPITADEVSSLAAYLDGGGRLLLSSQDFLYHHRRDPFSTRYLGVLTYTEDVTPTLLSGVSENLVSDGLGPWPLSYPHGYQNWSDALVPAPDVGVAFRDQGHRATALTRRADRDATLFLAFPFEALPSDARPMLMEQGIGWLSSLGGSTFEAHPRSVGHGDSLTYTVTLRNDGLEPVTASVSNTLPSEVAIASESLAGPGSYDPASRQVSWRGAVGSNEVVTIAYQAVVSGTTGLDGPIVNTARVSLEDQALAFDRSAHVRLDAPDLSSSAFTCRPVAPRPGRLVSCTLSLVNSGPVTANAITADIHPPGGYALAPASLVASKGTVERAGDRIIWRGPLGAGGQALLTFELSVSSEPVKEAMYGVAFLEDGVGGTWERPAWITVHPWQVYLPTLIKE